MRPTMISAELLSMMRVAETPRPRPAAPLDICQIDSPKTVTYMTCVTTLVGPIVNYHFESPRPVAQRPIAQSANTRSNKCPRLQTHPID